MYPFPPCVIAGTDYLFINISACFEVEPQHGIPYSNCRLECYSVTESNSSIGIEQTTWAAIV